MCFNFCGDISKFDLIGPYFTSSDGLDSRFTLACLYETMQSLESIGFKVKGDGASSNLSMVKRLCNEYVANVGVDEDTHCEEEETPKNVFFKNPFSDENCYVVNCPSHHVSNVTVYVQRFTLIFLFVCIRCLCVYRLTLSHLNCFEKSE